MLLSTLQGVAIGRFVLLAILITLSHKTFLGCFPFSTWYYSPCNLLPCVQLYYPVPKKRRAAARALLSIPYRVSVDNLFNLLTSGFHLSGQRSTSLTLLRFPTAEISLTCAVGGTLVRQLRLSPYSDGLDFSGIPAGLENEVQRCRSGSNRTQAAKRRVNWVAELL